MSFISDKELQSRVERLRGLIKDKGLNGIIVYSDEYRSGYCTYFTGYKPINVIDKNRKVEVFIKFSLLFISPMSRINEKDEDIEPGSVKDSRNNNADPSEINSKKPFKILIINIPKNSNFLFLSSDLNNKKVDLINLKFLFIYLYIRKKN